MQSAIDRAVALWKLTELKAIHLNTHKAVFSAESAGYGSVILKWDADRTQLSSEYEMLSRLNGVHSSRVYGFDEPHGLLLEERILPGTPVRMLPDLDARIDAFCQVFRSIHLPAQEGKTYLDWLDAICRFCADHSIDARLTDDAEKARQLCREIYAQYPDRVLLHADLHHDNILSRADGTYAVIDPKGIIGPAILDIPRFLLNEPTERSHLEQVMEKLSRRLGYPSADMKKIFYVETILANVWHIEDGEAVDEGQLSLARSLPEA